MCEPDPGRPNKNKIKKTSVAFHGGESRFCPQQAKSRAEPRVLAVVVVEQKRHLPAVNLALKSKVDPRSMEKDTKRNRDKQERKREKN